MKQNLGVPPEQEALLLKEGYLSSTDRVSSPSRPRKGRTPHNVEIILRQV